jgi:hypothetical protein
MLNRLTVSFFMSHDYWQWQWQRNRILTPRRKGAKGSHDLSRLESGERNLVKPKAREGRVSGRERVHFTNWHELKHAEGVMEISPVLTRSGYAGKTSPIKSLSALGREPG